MLFIMRYYYYYYHYYYDYYCVSQRLLQLMELMMYVLTL